MKYIIPEIVQQNPYELKVTPFLWWYKVILLYEGSPIDQWLCGGKYYDVIKRTKDLCNHAYHEGMIRIILDNNLWNKEIS